MPINKKEIKILEKNDWVMVCESPLEFERYAQFAGGVHKMTTEEEMREELEQIKVSKDFYDWLKERDKKENKEKKDIQVEKLKDATKELLNGITTKSLLNFMNVSNEFIEKSGDTYLAEHIEAIFQTAFDEVDPP